MYEVIEHDEAKWAVINETGLIVKVLPAGIHNDTFLSKLAFDYANKLNELEGKITDTAIEAEAMLWEHVRTQFPGATTGDLSPDCAMRLSAAIKDAVEQWVIFNVKN